MFRHIYIMDPVIEEPAIEIEALSLLFPLGVTADGPSGALAIPISPVASFAVIATIFMKPNELPAPPAPPNKWVPCVMKPTV